MQPKSEELLVIELKAGFEEAFTEIYNRYYVRLHMEANFKLQDKEEAADIVHDVFTTIWNNRHHLPENLSLKAYLCCCVKNKCIDKLRQSTRFQQYANHRIEIKELVTKTDPVINKELATEIHKAIRSLPSAQRKVIELSVVGFSHKEIMTETGKSIQTIKNLLGTAKKTLRQRLLIVQHT
jgi:RNA polymerase sigma-70 factor (family 1)